MNKQETDLKEFISTLQKMVNLLNNDVKSRITNCEHVTKSKHVECKKPAIAQIGCRIYIG